MTKKKKKWIASPLIAAWGLVGAAFVLASFGGTVPVIAAGSEPTAEERAAKSRAVVKAFAKRLKGELIGAMKSGGPVSAIAVCNSAAPAISEEASESSGWQVGRTALKLRNPANAPDDWERKVLERFEADIAKGADPKTLEHFETTTLDGRKVFRYMKAIPVGKPCLTCHGTDLKPELAAKIKELYPDDQATGFKLGQLRGAFTIVQPLQ